MNRFNDDSLASAARALLDEVEQLEGVFPDDDSNIRETMQWVENLLCRVEGGVPRNFLRSFPPSLARQLVGFGWEDLDFIKSLQPSRNCGACNGDGYNLVLLGGSGRRKVCPACQGNGSTYPLARGHYVLGFERGDLLWDAPWTVGLYDEPSDGDRHHVRLWLGEHSMTCERVFRVSPAKAELVFHWFDQLNDPSFRRAHPTIRPWLYSVGELLLLLEPERVQQFTVVVDHRQQETLLCECGWRMTQNRAANWSWREMKADAMVFHKCQPVSSHADGHASE